MRKLFLMIVCNLSIIYSFGQIEVLDFEKFKECRLNIQISYKDREADFKEAEKYKDIEIVMIVANEKGKVKSIERGYVTNLVKGDFKGTFFEPSSTRNTERKIAQFPLFLDRKVYCYNAKCFDEIDKR